MCLITTGMPNSHKNTFLSSAVETILLLLLINVTVFIEPKCSSYCNVISPLFASYWYIFLLAEPTKNIFCLSQSGLNFTTYGILLFVKLLITFPVSVSHKLIILSYALLRN